MKKIIRTQPLRPRSGTANAALLSISLILAALAPEAKSYHIPGHYPLCVLIDEDGTLIKGDALGNSFCATELDLAAMTTDDIGFAMTTDDIDPKLKKKPYENRQLWVDLKNAAQLVAGPAAANAKLPQGFFEARIQTGSLNDETPACTGEVLGVSSMTPGETKHVSLTIGFIDSAGGDWRLRFGAVACGTVFSSELFSTCRAVITAGDLNNDGTADIWTIEPEPGKNAEARLIKVNKRQQFDDWGTYSVPFKLSFQIIPEESLPQ